VIQRLEGRVWRWATRHIIFVSFPIELTKGVVPTSLVESSAMAMPLLKGMAPPMLDWAASLSKRRLLWLEAWLLRVAKGRQGVTSERRFSHVAIFSNPFNSIFNEPLSIQFPC
jgi:hypothetical protein